ncbi:MAG: phosphotransferase family protein [Nocardioidaceae bacterium]
MIVESRPVLGEEGPTPWQGSGLADTVVTAGGDVIPVRATARRPAWASLPLAVRHLIETSAGAPVSAAESTGTGFTPGFASRLALADGRSIFVKAASSTYDALHGWALSDAYREEVRKRRLLPHDIGAPTLLWHLDVDVDEERWVIAAFEHIGAAPPRRPWRSDQLRSVVNKLEAIAPALTPVPTGLSLESADELLMSGFEDRMGQLRSRSHNHRWLDAVEQLCRDHSALLAGSSVVHMDLRDDNVLISATGEVWFVDWNWPVAGAPWIDLVCLLLSAGGDGHDVEAVLAQHPLTDDVDPVAVDALLAVLWSFWADGMLRPVVASSPHLRAHQAWYADVTRNWLDQRLARR